MAIKKVYALQDKAANAYCQPFCFNTETQALRAMEDLLKDQSTNPSRYPQDYSLYEIAEFDEHTGIMIGHPQPQLVQDLIQIFYEIENKKMKEVIKNSEHHVLDENNPETRGNK